VRRAKSMCIVAKMRLMSKSFVSIKLHVSSEN
jgi:hypothetical protein